MALIENLSLKATQGSTPYKYLGVITTEGGNKGFLEYSTDAVLSKNAMFKVENAPGGLVHIRSCLVNKYWTRSSANGDWIVAKGEERVNDKTSWMCTLFRMDLDAKRKAIFYHVKSGKKLGILNDISDRKMFLTIYSRATTAVSDAIDLDTFVILPKSVAFKGSNGLFYKNYSNAPGNDGYSHFSVKDIGDRNIVCEIAYTNDGHIRVKAGASKDDDMYWYYSSPSQENLIVWSPDKVGSLSSTFAVIRVGDKTSNKIALRSLKNNMICQRADVKNSMSKKDRLVASADGMLTDTHLEVVETVINRTVNVYEFDLDNARIYNQELIFSHSHGWNNWTDQPGSGTADGRITSTRTKTWSNGVSIMVGVKTSFTTGIPFIAEGHIEVSNENTYSGQWGGTEEKSEQVGDIFQVVTKPMKRTIARGVATKGLCDVPFSYVQKDFPANGDPPVTTRFYNGIFTGANAYGFESEVRYEDLPPAKLGPDHQRRIQEFTLPAQKPIPL